MIQIILTTFPDGETARQIGTVLIEKQLAACVNIVPGIESIYRWDGEMQRESEVLALIKTTEAAWPQLEKTLAELHPYDVPEIIALNPDRGSKPYLDWVAENTVGA